MAQQSSAHSAPACAVPQGCGGEHTTDVTPCPGEGWDVCWHRAGFVCVGHVEPLPQGGGVWGRQAAGGTAGEASSGHPGSGCLEGAWSGDMAKLC